MERLDTNPPTLSFKNVGNGPALDVDYSVEVHGEEVADLRCDDLLRGEAFDTQIARHALGNEASISIECQSMGGQRYWTLASVRGCATLTGRQIQKLDAPGS